MAAPDGSPVELYALLPADDASRLVSRALGPRVGVLELGCGAGRMTSALVRLGHPVVAVDQSPEMLAHVRGAEAVLADIETLDLGRRFAGVVLASQLVNTADDAQRAAFLAACRRHLAPGGKVLVQRYDPEAVWCDGATSEVDGVTYGLKGVRRDGPALSATVTYDLGDGRRFEHAFRARILDDAATDAALAEAGLVRRRYLDEGRTWFEAERRRGGSRRA